MFRTNRWMRTVYRLWGPIYDPLARWFAPHRKRSIDLLAIRPGERVLIPGAGTGLDLPFIPKGASIAAIDITPAMVERLRRRAASLGVEVDARVMDAQSLEFPDASFDAAILHLVLAVVPEPRRLAAEVARVLRPGGRAAIMDKFLPDAGQPPLPLPFRIATRALELPARFFGTQLRRRLGPILEGLPLEIVRREPAGGGGYLNIILVEKR